MKVLSEVSLESLLTQTVSASRTTEQGKGMSSTLQSALFLIFWLPLFTGL